MASFRSDNLDELQIILDIFSDGLKFLSVIGRICFQQTSRIREPSLGLFKEHLGRVSSVFVADPKNLSDENSNEEVEINI